MSKLNLHHLHLFRVVARHRNLTRAAEELFISQPSVSAQLRDLERELGLPLFDRLPRGIRLTSAGEIVADYAQRIFSLAGDLESAIADLRGLAAGRVIIGASTTIGEYLLLDAVAGFRSRYPAVELQVRISNTATILEALAGHALDLGLVGEVVEDARFVVEPFHSDSIVIIAPSGHPLGEAAVQPSALAGESFVAREMGSATRHTGEQELARHGIQPHVVMELGSNEAVKRAVAAGLGLALISSAAIQFEAQAGLIRVLMVENWHCERMLSIVHRRDKRLGRAEQAFLAILRNETVTPQKMEKT